MGLRLLFSLVIFVVINGCSSTPKRFGASIAPGVWDYGHYKLPVNYQNETDKVAQFSYRFEDEEGKPPSKKLYYAFDFPLFARGMNYKFLETNAVGVKCRDAQPTVQYFYKRKDTKSDLGDPGKLVVNIPAHVHAYVLLDVENPGACERIDFRLTVLRFIE